MNLGSGREITIKNLTELVARLAKFKGTIVWDATKPTGQPRRCLDVTRAKETIGFVAEPRWKTVWPARSVVRKPRQPTADRGEGAR